MGHFVHEMMLRVRELEVSLSIGDGLTFYACCIVFRCPRQCALTLNDIELFYT